MKKLHAVATWDEDGEGWDIEFPDGIFGMSTLGTCTGDGKHTKWHAEYMARDLVVCHAEDRLRVEDVELSIEWKGVEGGSPVTIRPLALLFVASLLAACSDEDRAARAEHRAAQIEAEIQAKARAGTLSADEFAARMDEMVDLAKTVRDAKKESTPPPAAPSLEELRAAHEELQQDLTRNIRAARARLGTKPKPRADPAEIARLRAEAEAATDTLADLYDTWVAELRKIAAAHRSPGERGLVNHEVREAERIQDRELTRLRRQLASDNPSNLKGTRDRAELLASSLRTSVEATADRLKKLTSGSPRPRR